MSGMMYDAIVILGGGVGMNGELPDSAKPALEKAAELYREDSSAAIIVCGSHSYKATQKPGVSEARAYANYLEGLGMPSESIYLETESQETLGNILFAKMRIFIKHEWKKLLVIPSINHSTERINYLLQKILGSEYSWEILRVLESGDPTNAAREAKSLEFTREINDAFRDGDHEAIYRGLKETHPAYGGTKWTVDELREELGNAK